jgi:hypothetical protein
MKITFKYNKVITAVLLSLILVINFSLANVIVFEKYDTTYSFEKNYLKIEKDLRILNVGPNPIIPGEIHFKLSEIRNEKQVPIKINNLKIIDHRGNEIDSKLSEKAEQTDLSFMIWQPLLPRHFYDLSMEYEVEFNPKGIFFYMVNIPKEVTTIPIQKSTTTFELPKKYHITYAPNGTVEKTSDYNKLSWNELSILSFEYSLIPLPKMGIPMVNFFWIGLMVVFLMVFIVRIIRNRN